MLDTRITSRSLAALLVTFIFGACGGGDAGNTDAADAADATGGETPAAATVENPGVIRGMVMFTGEAPANPTIDMSQEQVCADKHATQPTTNEVVVTDGHMANVFVYVKEGLSGSFPAASDPVVIDQNGCEYVPHVAGVQVGQELRFKNSDGVLHNIKAVPTANRGFNISQPTTMESAPPQPFRTAEVMVPIECDAHGWMKAYVGVVDHPYFAVTSTDGAFEISNLPPGTYTIEAWHEKYGTQTQQVTVAPDGTVEANFSYDASMANAYVPLAPPLDPHDHGVVVAHAGH